MITHPPKRTFWQKLVLALWPRKPLRLFPTLPMLLKKDPPIGPLVEPEKPEPVIELRSVVFSRMYASLPSEEIEHELYTHPLVVQVYQVVEGKGPQNITDICYLGCDDKVLKFDWSMTRVTENTPISICAVTEKFLRRY